MATTGTSDPRIEYRPVIIQQITDRLRLRLRW